MSLINIKKDIYSQLRKISNEKNMSIRQITHILLLYALHNKENINMGEYILKELIIK